MNLEFLEMCFYPGLNGRRVDNEQPRNCCSACLQYIDGTLASKYNVLSTRCYEMHPEEFTGPEIIGQEQFQQLLSSVRYAAPFLGLNFHR
jgi:hypothetical protein